MSIEKASKAGFSLLIRKVWASFLNLIVMGILARELPLADFGIVAASMILMNWMSTITSAGLDDFIILYKGNEPKEMQKAAFSLSFWVSILLVGVLVLIAPWWSDFYGNEHITHILYLLGFCFFFDMISVVPKALLRKKMEYKKLVKVQIIIGTIASLLKIFGALYGWGVYSLILPLAIVAPVQALYIFYISKSKLYQHLFYFRVELWKEAYRFTSFIIGSRLLNKLMNEGDNLIVGKTLGLESLGIYNIAYQSANFIVGIITGIVGDISTPVFAKVSHNTKRLKETVLRLLHLFGFIAVPILCIILVYADKIIYILYGSQFFDAAIPLKLLSIFALFRMINSPSSNIFNALHQPRKPFYIQLIAAPIFLVIIYFSSLHGLIFFTAAVAVSRSIFSFILLQQSGTLINLTVREIANAILPFVQAMIPMSFALLIARIPSFHNIYIDFAVCIGAIVAGIYIYLHVLKYSFYIVWERTKRELVNIHPSLKFLERI